MNNKISFFIKFILLIGKAATILMSSFMLFFSQLMFSSIHIKLSLLNEIVWITVISVASLTITLYMVDSDIKKLRAFIHD